MALGNVQQREQNILYWGELEEKSRKNNREAEGVNTFKAWPHKPTRSREAGPGVTVPLSAVVTQRKGAV